MTPSRTRRQRERDKTDKSLRTERSNTDEALGHARASVEDAADAIVVRAREQADVVLDIARDKADKKLDASQDELKASGAAASGAAASGAVARERDRADEVLKAERAAEDEKLHFERLEQVRILVELLPLEREKTDQFLLTERARSDDSVANRDDFLGMVSHDLRNLLGGIGLKAKLLSKQASESDEGRRTVAGMEHIQRYVARMNRIVGDLVDVVSIDSGKFAVHPQRCDAMQFVAEAVEAFAHSAHEKRVTLELEPSPQSQPVACDHDRMFQVLANLIANALKFTPAGGLIKVCGERVDDMLRISVIDNGSGIPEERQEAVFERFWQVGKDDHRGLGLGLYISRRIVIAHGGRIWVHSKLGLGSAFHFTIPLAVEAHA